MNPRTSRALVSALIVIITVPAWAGVATAECTRDSGVTACRAFDADAPAPHAWALSLNVQDERTAWQKVPHHAFVGVSVGSPHWRPFDTHVGIVVYVGSRIPVALVGVQITCTDGNGDGVPTRCYTRGPLPFTLPDPAPVTTPPTVVYLP